MSRQPTANYGAVSTTQFQWATTDNDFFDRELDLYNLAQAVENHDHSNARGLAVSRLAAGAVIAASIGALAVQTAALDALAVTNAKLAAGAVTQDKITYPLIQPTDNMTGGVRIRDTTNTYAFGYYVAANGLVVLGAGASPGTAITGNLVMGQTGQVTVGSVQGGGARLNVMQPANTAGNGLRLYHTDLTHVGDIYVNAAEFLVLSSASIDAMWLAGGKVSIGAASITARLNVRQLAGTQAEGYYQDFGAGNFSHFIDANGDVNIRSAGTSLMLKHTTGVLHPLSNGGADLGLPGTRWGTIYAANLDVTGTITGVIGVPANGIIMFQTAAQLTAAGASWVRETFLDGRIAVGAGTTFAQTFTEATNYGANWTPLTGVATSATGSGPFTAAAASSNNPTGATNVEIAAHTHPIPTTTWLPPMRAVVFARRV